jgi:hypothetical protein
MPRVETSVDPGGDEMSAVDIDAVLDGTPEFVAFAVEQLASSLGDEHPRVAEGRRALAALDVIPRSAVLVTEESLAAALRRAWPSGRNSPTGLALSAAVILAALRAGAPPAPRRA